MNYYVVNLGRNPTNQWWLRTVQLGVITAGFSGQPGDEGERAMLLPASGDWVIAYANGHGYVGAGIAGQPSDYRLVRSDELPIGYESTHRHWRGVKWKYVIPRLDDALTHAEAGRHPPPNTIQAIRDPSVAQNIISLLASRCPKLVISNPEEITSDTEYWEGSVVQIIANRYERDPAARAACIKHYGCSCQACGMTFQERYGTIGDGFIHVHHVVPLSTIHARYKVDPINDLVPLCANCHSMVHRENPPLTIAQLKSSLSSGE